MIGSGPSLAELDAELARRGVRAGTAPTGRLEAYHGDPVAFVRDCLIWRPGEGPAAYQVEVLAQLPTRRRVAVRGPHGLGKTTLAAWAVLWFALTRDADPEGDWKIPTTASGWRQLVVYLWPEIRKWARRLRWDRLARGPFDPRTELLTLTLKLERGEGFALASDQPATLEGAHARSLLYIFDEAKAIPPATWDAAEGAFAGAGSDTLAEAFALAISTPGEPSGRFYAIHHRQPGYEDWWTRHVTRDEAIAAGRMSATWADQRRRQWGATSAVYQNRVEGEFAAQDEASVIPLAWVERANERWRDQQAAGWSTGVPLTSVGVDVGLTADRTVQALRVDQVLLELRRLPHQDTMATAGAVVGLLEARGGRAVIDVIGIGAGVVHRVRELGLPVVPFHAAEGTAVRDRSGELGFVNLRSAAWWALRERLDPAGAEAVALPPDDLLTGDLTAPRWRLTSTGRLQVESKDDITRRLGRSPDDGDAVVMAFALELLQPVVAGVPIPVGDAPSYWLTS
jgi:hypothetical protein